MLLLYVEAFDFRFTVEGEIWCVGGGDPKIYNLDVACFHWLLSELLWLTVNLTEVRCDLRRHC